MEIPKIGQNYVQESSTDTKQASSDQKVISEIQKAGFESLDVLETATPPDPFSTIDLGVGGQNDEIPDSLETITGGHKSAETPGSGSDKTTTSEEHSPTSATWADAIAKGRDRSLGVGPKERPEDTSTTDAGKNPDGTPIKGKTVGLDYFNQTKQVMDDIIMDGDDVKKLKPEDGHSVSNPFPEPKILAEILMGKNRMGTSDPVIGSTTVERGFGKNKVSKQDEQSDGKGSTRVTKSGSITKYETKDMIITDRYDLSGKLRSTTVRNSEGAQFTAYFDKAQKLIMTEHISPNGVKTTTKPPQETTTPKEHGPSVDVLEVIKPAPDSDDVDPSHLPKELQGGEKTLTQKPGTGTEQVTLTDENKRQYERVSVLRSEVLGSMVGRLTDGRSTPVESDGTTPDADSGYNTPPGFDLGALHRKGDPDDGDPSTNE